MQFLVRTTNVDSMSNIQTKIIYHMRTQNNDPNTFETGKSILCGLIIHLHASKIHQASFSYMYIRVYLGSIPGFFQFLTWLFRFFIKHKIRAKKMMKNYTDFDPDCQYFRVRKKIVNLCVGVSVGGHARTNGLTRFFWTFIKFHNFFHF